jgi:hypothetical protein
MGGLMNPSYGRARGDLSGATYVGRVDVFYDGQIERDPWGRASTKRETYWTAPGDGDSSGLAAEVAARLGGEVRLEYYDAATGYRWVASDGLSIVVVPAAKDA